MYTLSMVRFRKDLYLSDNIAKVDKIKRGLKSGRGKLNLYVIALAKGSDQLEYFHNGLLKQDIFYKEDHYIVGLASGEEECKRIISDIAKDTYSATGTYDMRSFLLGDDSGDS